MKKKRLDAILIERGFVTEAQIRQALLRQKSRGGRLGSNLLFFGYLTEGQLAAALADQFGVSSFLPESLGDIAPEILGRIPIETAEEFLVIPFRYDTAGRILHLAVADPEDARAIAAIRQAARGGGVQIHIAPEMTIRGLISLHYRGRQRDPSADRIIDLPDIFGEEEAPEKDARRAGGPAAAEKAPRRRALLLTDQLFQRNILPSIFEREGWDLAVASDMDQAMEEIRSTAFERILVSESLEKNLVERLAGVEGKVPEIAVLGSIPSTLMERRVPYSRMMESLLRAVQALAESRSPAAESRSPGSGWKPPYAPIERDAERLGRAIGLPCLAVDGLRLLVHLLVPAPIPAGRPGEKIRIGPGTFTEMPESRRLAAHLDFPWDLGQCLETFEKILAGTEPPRDPGRAGAEMNAAAQVLAVVWSRSLIAHSRSTGPETLAGLLRDQAGLIASPAVIESYLRILDRELSGTGEITTRDIFVIEGMEKIPFPAVSELKRHGYRPVAIGEPSEIRHLASRRKPSGILFNLDNGSMEAVALARSLKLEGRGGSSALFGFTSRTEPSLVMDLLEAGFADVFTPPFLGPVIMARITRTLSVFAEKAVAADAAGFAASFGEISFMDLIQALSSGGKNVRVEIEGGGGGRATVHLKAGRIVHAACGPEKGVEAVYRVIGWRDDGRFRVEPCDDFPPANVQMPNDYILLEGCRLLDELEELGLKAEG